MGHTFFNLLIHTVFSTKNRIPMISPELRGRLFPYMGGIARQEFGRALRIGGTENHVHALLSLSTDISVADALEKFKGLSSGWVHKTMPEYRHFEWQVGFGAFTVSQSKAASVVNYIAEQEEHHKKATFEEEFLKLLKYNRARFDPAHVWD